MGWFSKRSPEELELLRAEIASMSARLQASEQSRGELAKTVRGLTERLDSPMPPPTEPPPVTATVDPAEIDKLNARLQRLGDRVDEVGSAGGVDADAIQGIEARMQRITERLDELDGRITSISTELANQITELSGELDALGGREPATDEVVDELRDAQSRLAAEQARYQIAFRQDLADLADRLRRA